MSVLACNLSQEVNGVSWLHGEVSKEILGNMWPGYFKNELHIGYVTNGVHFPTWIATSLRRLYARYFADGFEGHAYDIPAWQKVHNIPDGELWADHRQGCRIRRLQRPSDHGRGRSARRHPYLCMVQHGCRVLPGTGNHQPCCSCTGKGTG